MFRHLCIADRNPAGEAYFAVRWPSRGMLTVIAARLQWLPRAASKRRHVLFSGVRRRCDRANARSAAGPQTISDCHDKQRHVASASRLCQGRSRLRARRGRLARRHQRRPLSRLHLGRRGECARPRPSAPGCRVAGAGDKTVAHVEPVQEPGRRQACRAAVRAEFCRFRVLL